MWICSYFRDIIKALYSEIIGDIDMYGEPKYFFKFIEGAVLGFATADALGVPVEFTSREQRRQDPVFEMRSGGVHGQTAGTWSDDTSMTLCMIHSLIEKGIDYEDQMARFADWMENGNYTAHGDVFDIGGATHRAINKFLSGNPAINCGDDSENACGNGSLMRIMPLAFYLEGKYGNWQLDERTAKIIHEASDLTHSNRRCEMACGIYCSIIFQMCSGGYLPNAVKGGLIPALYFYRDHPDYKDLYGEFEPLLNIDTFTEDDIKSGGYVLDTLKAAVWCLLTTESYADCVIKAVNLGRDTDTTAAVAGALAGMWYGANTIPINWTDTLAKYDDIKSLSKRFAYACFEAKEKR